MLSGTEAEIINSVVKLKTATKSQIKRELGLSSGYVGLLCRYLIRKEYLACSGGHYFLTNQGAKTLLKEEAPRIDRKLVKEIAGEVAHQISGEIKKTVEGIKVPVAIREIEKTTRGDIEKKIKIKTDFDFFVKDETSKLESNIGKIGGKIEKEKSDISKSVELFKNLQKKRRSKYA